MLEPKKVLLEEDLEQRIILRTVTFVCPHCGVRSIKLRIGEATTCFLCPECSGELRIESMRKGRSAGEMAS